MKPGDSYGNVEYENLAQSQNSLPGPKQRSHSRIIPFGAGCVTTLIFAAMLLAIKHAVSALGSPISPAEIEAEEWNYCGRSSLTAKARGCVMEPLFYGWMPPQCVFPELTSAHPVFEDRKFYKDRNMTMELAPEQLWAGEEIMVYTHRYHGEHCLFQWRKLQYAMDHRMEFLDNKTISLHHTTHCADQLSVGCEGPQDVN
ncbi:uncharacterized protein BCR38DRAFT_471714 [Pseudomassariella vexata]|uniref:Uncharacterized protein n=1 Tax=Pseudomassariella vexata TaxID=1141098 RepID=A0A1Y2EGI5_9PEZI|nr:uncharacterized protein BCR38DRAFT_471714 [Pseudomassariella vexata]ORY70414.1 hypothetical protein BCR38DRAFT_471714 [Pseudomassariella vexata]